jgi:tRNA(fMet)-specific endonuclease VapC
MMAFDTDILSLLLINHPTYTVRLMSVPPRDRFVPVVAVGEMFRGRLAAVRAAEAKKGGATLAQTYGLFEQSLLGLGDYEFKLLSYLPAADAQFAAWRAAKVRVGTQDLRIAAISHTTRATLVTRNARDFAQVPGLQFVVWP